jgi:hypothetical protein
MPTLGGDQLYLQQELAAISNAISTANAAITANTAGLAASLSVNGYQKLPSGLIIQWGSATPSGGVSSVTFPIAFPHALFAVVGTLKTASTTLTESDTFNTSATSTTGFTGQHRFTAGATAPAAATQPVFWVAIGY